MFAPRLLLRPLLPPLRRMPAPAPRRHVLHLPLIVGAGKVLAGAGLKKLALNSVVRKLGPQRVLSEMHAANSSLHAAQPEVYTAEMFNATHDGLRLFERSLQGLHEHEQLLRAWGWFERLEKDNPSLAQVLLKTYLEAYTPVKWASALLRTVDPAPPKGATEGAPAPASAGAATGAAGVQPGTAETDALLRKLQAAFPDELRDYHVVLVPRDDPSR